MLGLTRASEGAEADGCVVRFESMTPHGCNPSARVGAPIGAMLTAAGDAWAAFVLVEGNGDVLVTASTEGSDSGAPPDGEVACSMSHGGVILNGAWAVENFPDWGPPMAPGESVRVRYVAATRMIAVAWRGRWYAMCELPATADIAHTRFGVILSADNSIRLTGASTAGAFLAL
jgi:hypothetical protein